jgi:hypothetical protein
MYHFAGTRLTDDFTQIGRPFTFISDIATDGTTHATSITPLPGLIMTCNEGTLSQCLMNTTTFQLRYEVYEGLRQMYVEQPLIIPTNILQYSRFSGEPTGQTKGSHFHATLSQSLENCDSIFILIPNDNLQHTTFYQPWLEQVRLSLGEFGTRPERYVQTYNDPRFLAMVLDSLNLETSTITAINEDVARSLTNGMTHYQITGAASDTISPVEHSPLFGDKSNFFIGISLSQVGFQSGTVSSPNTNVPFIFDATYGKDLSVDSGSKTPINTSIVIMFLLDCALMIQVLPDSDIPIVKLTSKSIV